MASVLPRNLRWTIVLLLVIALIDLRLYVLARETKEQILADTRATLHSATGILQRRTDQLLNIADRTLSGISEVISSRGGIPPTPDLYLHRLLVRRHAITPSLRWLFLVRPDAELAELSSEFPSPKANVSDREYFQLPATHWDIGLYIGPRVTSRFDGKDFIPISRRVVSDGGRFLGVVAAGIEPSEVDRLLSDQSLPDGYRARLLHKNGKVLACFPKDIHCQDHKKEDDYLLQDKREEESPGTFTIPATDNSKEIGMYARSISYPIMAVTTVDQEKVLQRWRQGLWNYWLIGIGSNALLIGLALFGFRQFERRRQAISELEESNRNLELRVLERTNDLHKREAQARIFMNTALDAVIVISGGGEILEFNIAAERMFGYSKEELLGRPLSLLMPDNFSNTHQSHVETANRHDAIRKMAQGREVLGRTKEGNEFPIEVSVGSASETNPILHVGIIRDISERKRVEDELKRLATIDTLTGILNRRAFNAEAERLITLSQRYERPLSLMILDADKFKNINDTYGHPAGDLVLQALARAIESVLRQTDVFGRLGGEEFGLVLPETDINGAQLLGERLLQAIRNCTVETPEQHLRFTVSIGLAPLGQGEQSNLEATMRIADQALYAAKQGGRNCLYTATN